MFKEQVRTVELERDASFSQLPDWAEDIQLGWPRLLFPKMTGGQGAVNKQSLVISSDEMNNNNNTNAFCGLVRRSEAAVAFSAAVVAAAAIRRLQSRSPQFSCGDTRQERCMFVLMIAPDIPAITLHTAVTIW